MMQAPGRADSAKRRADTLCPARQAAAGRAPWGGAGLPVIRTSKQASLTLYQSIPTDEMGTMPCCTWPQQRDWLHRQQECLAHERDMCHLLSQGCQQNPHTPAGVCRLCANRDVQQVHLLSGS